MKAAKIDHLSENCLSPQGRERQGEQSSLAFKGTCNEMARYEQSCFDMEKRVLFYTTIEKC